MPTAPFPFHCSFAVVPTAGNMAYTQSKTGATRAIESLPLPLVTHGNVMDGPAIYRFEIGKPIDAWYVGETRGFVGRCCAYTFMIRSLLAMHGGKGLVQIQKHRFRRTQYETARALAAGAPITLRWRCARSSDKTDLKDDECDEIALGTKLFGFPPVNSPALGFERMPMSSLPLAWQAVQTRILDGRRRVPRGIVDV